MKRVRFDRGYREIRFPENETIKTDMFRACADLEPDFLSTTHDTRYSRFLPFYRLYQGSFFSRD